MNGQFEHMAMETQANSSIAALSGIKVTDFATGVAGPHVSLLLASHGADVVKIEPPEGDWSRTLGRSHGDLTAYSTFYNRGKKSIALNLKTDEGRDIAYQLATQADVVVESFRPGVMKRLGLDYATLSRARPDIVYLSMSGFGQQGPNVSIPATDTVIQGRSGFMYLNRGENGAPQRFPMIIIDVVSGLYGFQAVMAALMARMRFNRGAYIDCSLMQSALALQAPSLLTFQLEDGAPGPMYVPLGVLATRDSYLSISVNRDDHFIAFCKVIGRDDLGIDPRFAKLADRIQNHEELMRQIRLEFLKQTTDEWVRRLTQADLLHSRVHTYDELFSDARERPDGSFTWLHQSGLAAPIAVPEIPGQLTGSATNPLPGCPHIGEHTAEILTRAGYSEEQIAEFLHRRIASRPAV